MGSRIRTALPAVPRRIRRCRYGTPCMSTLVSVARSCAWTRPSGRGWNRCRTTPAPAAPIPVSGSGSVRSARSRKPRHVDTQLTQKLEPDRHSRGAGSSNSSKTGPSQPGSARSPSATRSPATSPPSTNGSQTNEGGHKPALIRLGHTAQPSSRGRVSDAPDDTTERETYRDRSVGRSGGGRRGWNRVGRSCGSCEDEQGQGHSSRGDGFDYFPRHFSSFN